MAHTKPVHEMLDSLLNFLSERSWRTNLISILLVHVVHNVASMKIIVLPHHGNMVTKTKNTFTTQIIDSHQYDCNTHYMYVCIYIYISYIIIN